MSWAETKSGIAVPAASGQGVAFTCGVCGAEFTRDQKSKWENHVGRCAKKHDDELAEASEINRRRNPLNQATDQEAVDFQRKRYRENV